LRGIVETDVYSERFAQVDNPKAGGKLEEVSYSKPFENVAALFVVLAEDVAGDVIAFAEEGRYYLEESWSDYRLCFHPHQRE